MEQQITNQEILEKLNKIQMDVNIIKEKLDEDGELSDLAIKELEEARNRKDKIPHEEGSPNIISKKSPSSS